MHGLSLRIEEGHAQMPLADHGGGVAGLAKHLREREPARLDQARAVDAGEHSAHAVAERHAARQNAVPGRRADCRRAVRVCEAQALPGKVVEVLGLDLRLVVVSAYVAVSEVVREDQQDVGRAARSAVLRATPANRQRSQAQRQGRGPRPGARSQHAQPTLGGVSVTSSTSGSKYRTLPWRRAITPIEIVVWAR